MRRIAGLAVVLLASGCVHVKTEPELIARIPLGISESEVLARLGPTSEVIEMPGGYVIRLWMLAESPEALSVVFDTCGRVMAVSDQDGNQRFQTPCALP